MTARFKVRWLPFLTLAALVACLTCTAAVHAQGHKGTPQADKKKAEEEARKAREAAKKAQDAAKKAQDAAKKAREAAAIKAREAKRNEMIYEEAHHLRQAIVLLNKANHDYDGHRVKAIAQLKDAEKILDAHVMKHGTARQKEATVEEKKAVAASDEENRRNSMLHERQKRSDEQLKEAKTLAHKVRHVLSEHNQEEPLKHVGHAIKHLDIALEIR